jgi:RNA polymerase sigma factor (sigma-70 family)
MAKAQLDTVIRHLRRAALWQDGANRTDGQLLASFINKKDGAAFEALVRRHGPMVFGVCRRVVGHFQDAQDAFQATLLVLARNASSIKQRERVANWLHGVALRTAMKAKSISAKRRGREKQVTEMPEPEAAQQDLWRDLQPLLDQELNGLPEHYRLPILLCELEGKTIKDAAQQLGWPQGTVAGRLARGRKLLAKRLTNRGVVLSAGSLAAVISQNEASAGMPTSLMSSTVKAATMIAAGQATVAGMVPAKVAALTEGVMKMMLFTKLKIVIVMLVVATLSGVAGAIWRTQAAEPSAVAQTQQNPQADNREVGKVKPPADVELRKTAVPAPMAYEPKKALYRLKCSLLKADPNGKEFGAEGKARLLCEPMLLAPEGQELSFIDGSMKVFAEDSTCAFEPFPQGISARMKVIGGKNGTLTLIATLEMNEQEKTANKYDLQYSGKVLRSVTHVKPGEVIKLVLDKDDSGKPRFWAQIELQAAGFIETRWRIIPERAK